MAMDLNLKFDRGGGKVDRLPENITTMLIRVARNELAVPPSYLITKLHYEGYWGYSEVAIINNNWSGMSWNPGWTEPNLRDSGVITTRGSSRPASEGGHYIKYASNEDFFKDWTYTIRRGGTFNVADSKTFDEAVLGMFRYGGANGDYATMHLNTSKARYEAYLKNMKARRDAINSQNNNALSRIDNGEDGLGSEPLPDDTWDKPNIIDNLKDLFEQIRNATNDNYVKLFEAINEIFNSSAVHYGDSQKYVNKMIKIQEINGNNLLKLTPNADLLKLIQESNSQLNKDIGDIINNVDNVTKPSDPQMPPVDGGGQPAYPVDPQWPVTSVYGSRVIFGRNDFHGGTDWGAPSGAPIYAVQSGEVIENRWGTGAGWLIMIKHSGDHYYSVYQHLVKQSSLGIGTKVTKGQVIANVGNTGIGTGAHLHLEIATDPSFFWKKDGRTTDPQKYLKSWF